VGKKGFSSAPENRTLSHVPRSRLMTIGVLIVEDEFLLRLDAVDFMEGYGFTMHEAGNADEAIAILEVHDDIRAVFTDINMPGSMDGLKLAHYVRGHWPPIKLIITSGQAKPLAEDMPPGCMFVAKPYELEKVANDLRAMID
jgi:CheY-like chemotaxis protein